MTDFARHTDEATFGTHFHRPRVLHTSSPLAHAALSMQYSDLTM